MVAHHGGQQRAAFHAGRGCELGNVQHLLHDLGRRQLQGPAQAVEAGMGLVCNNVLHDREGFTDDPAAPRLLYRARFLDRIASE